MKAPLIPLNEDFKWKLLSEILNVFDLRSYRQITDTNLDLNWHTKKIIRKNLRKKYDDRKRKTRKRKKKV